MSPTLSVRLLAMGIAHFVLFAHARSGSTSLARALERSPDVRILMEPFNESFTRWNPGATDYRATVTDAASLDAALPELYADHDGIKVLDYQRPREVYTHLLTTGDRNVVFLRRRNLLRTCVSVELSEQTGIWHRWDGSHDDAVLDAISIDAVRKRLVDLEREMTYYDGVIASLPPERVFRLAYEDLYSPHGADLVAVTLAFLGAEPVVTDETLRLLDPAHTQLNRESVYRRIPNAREIDAELGDDGTGRLFD
jgi:LPS sulfotransferase NodH